MLKASLTRPLARRYFSTSVWRWNLPKGDQPASVTKGVEDTKGASPADVKSQSSEAASTWPDPIDKPETLPDTDNLTSPPNNTNPRQQLDEVRERVKEHVRGWADIAALKFRTKADEFTAHAKANFSQLGIHLNRVTGYEEIEALKKAVVAQEIRINKERQAARDAKKFYEEAVSRRSKSQREVNDLLSRKSTWTDHDVSHFTTIVREDQLLEQAETAAKLRVDEMENAVEREFSRLMRTILDRYHEEQVWSDKIRSASTYGSLAALGLNMLVFVTAILFVEPWKRRRLAATFEEKVEALARETDVRLDASLKEMGGKFAVQERLISEFAKDISERISGPTLVREVVREVERERGDVAEKRTSIQEESYQRRNLELAGVAAGAFAAGVLSYVLLGR